MALTCRAPRGEAFPSARSRNEPGAGSVTRTRSIAPRGRPTGQPNQRQVKVSHQHLRAVPGIDDADADADLPSARPGHTHRQGRVTCSCPAAPSLGAVSAGRTTRPSRGAFGVSADAAAGPRRCVPVGSRHRVGGLPPSLRAGGGCVYRVPVTALQVSC
jgi:hypothetical protein